ncbi:MAG: T9SS type A sorting domain-containing protein [Phycisphaerales bacterium]|nr:T9SS type A sorting domain-containing protein [Phycisphaerales bacterium]
MKKSILILFYSFILAINLNAQTVFAPPNSVWYSEYHKDFGDGSSNYLKYETLKDTTYYGKLCSKVITRNIKVSFSGTIIDTNAEKPIYTYVSGDTVFYYNDNFSRFYPLYIFNVKVGDTVTYHVPYIPLPKTDTTFSIVVDSIKNITINGINSRIIWSKKTPVSVFTLGILIERLGVINGSSFIGHSYTLIPTASSGGLRCYRDAMIDTNLNKFKLDCEVLKPTSISTIPTYLEEVKISPNPTQGKVIIEIPKFLREKVNYSVFNEIGQKITIEALDQGDIIKFDLTDFPKGLYYLQLSSKEGLYYKTHKLLKN